MNNSKIFKTILVALILIATPLTASAFWPFAKKVTPKSEVALNDSFTEADKEIAKNKYKIWERAFEEKNVDVAINNQNNFSYSVKEINYLIEEVSKSAKKPTFTNAKLDVNGSTINVSATFHKIIKGRFSFNAQVISVDNKVRLSFNNVKLYGISFPTKWFASQINKALDDYFSFLYKDSRYQGFSFSVEEDVLTLKPIFKDYLNLSKN